jgi:benzodiazapine receptor
MELIGLLAFLTVTACAASTGSLFMPGRWYKMIAKPSWTPPNWLFPVAWTPLYVMIALAGWTLWKSHGWNAALDVWLLQLVFNALWSPIMFWRKNIALALVDLIILWLCIVGFIVMAWPLNATSAYLFLPYCLWVSFAGYLNFRILRMNPAEAGFAAGR